MHNLPTDSVLVWDIETDSLNTDEAKLRYFGAYSYKTKKRYYLKGDDPTTINVIQDMFDNHDVIVGFNIRKFDMPIMGNYGIFFYKKIVVDLWEALSPPKIDMKTHTRKGGKGRGSYMGLDLNSWSLANIVSALQLGEYKQEGFDYGMFKNDPNEWTEEQESIIKEYQGQDITITKRLFEYTHNFYFPLTEHLEAKNILRFNYITASIASLAYKIICCEAKLDETYGEGEKTFEYQGGYVRYPTKEKYTGEILCLDFNSLYPSIFRGFNLFSPANVDDDTAFSGNDFFTLKGTYKTAKLGPVEEAVARLYALRQVYKKNGDRREYLIKIIINSLYGITPKPTFDQVYNRYAAEDCTAIGRQMIKRVAEVFDDNGYEVLYGDTDSVYVAMKDKSKEDALVLAKELSDFFMSKMPFPHDDFGLGLDAEIKTMFFFKFSDGVFKKKNYVYITKEGELKIMGLPIIKSNASKLAVHLLNKHLKEQIINNQEIKFPLGYLKQLIFHELENDLSLATQTYKVKIAKEYANPNSLYAQIAEKYGAGTIGLIPNNRYGIGKGKNYCTVKEFKENKLTVQDIDLSVTMNNLDPFIKQEQTNLGEFDA